MMKTRQISFEDLSYDELLKRFKEILRENKLKFTKQRELLLKTLYNLKTHYLSEELYVELKKNPDNKNLGIATVYRTLNLLEDAGLVTSISLGVLGKKFELANKPHHDHMICQECGMIIEFENELIEKEQKKVAKAHNFVLGSHIMQLYGLCFSCQEKLNYNTKEGKMYKR